MPLIRKIKCYFNFHSYYDISGKCVCVNFYVGNQILGLYNQSQQYYGMIWNFKRSSGGNTGDRFIIYYNPENNNRQYGYFNGNLEPKI
jgi:hypothetical protein